MPELIISTFDLRGDPVSETRAELSAREMAGLLTPDQVRALAAGMSVTVVSRRGRVDITRTDAAALRAAPMAVEPDRRQGPDRRSALAAGRHFHRLGLERRSGRDRRRAEQPC